jgi:DNA-binding LacI/PurR family transcriptional regulator
MLGWREGLAAAGIEPVVIKQPHTTEEDGYAALAPLLNADPGITAVLCFADTVAHGVMLAAQDQGLTIPDDLSVVGFDDNPLAARLRPALTTVRQDIAEKGRLAAELLIRTVAPDAAPPANATTTKPGEKNLHIVLPTELIVRASTGRPRSAAGRP